MGDSIISVANIDIESNDENKTDKSETANKDDNSKPHNGKPITIIEISPNGNYLVTHSKEDKSFVGWDVDNIEDEGELKVEEVYKDIGKDHEVKQICISDDKKLAYINDDKLKIIDMNNDNQEIKLYFDKEIIPYYCTFNLKGEFILCSYHYKHENYYKKIVWIYSTKAKNDKWNCIKIYELPEDVQLISISKYDKLYLFSNYYIYEWNILTEKSIRIFSNDEIKKCIENYYKLHGLYRASSNEKFICLRIKDKVIIHSIELEVLIASLDINNDIQLYNFMKDFEDLYPLLLTLFNNEQITSSRIWNSIMEYCWKECLGRLKQSPKEYQIESLPVPPFLFDNTTKFVFVILDGYVWKIKLEEISKINFSFKSPDEIIIENWYDYFDDDFKNKKMYEPLNIRLLNPCTDTIRELLQEIIPISYNRNDYKRELELTQDLIKLIVKIDYEKLHLQVEKNVNGQWGSICTICTHIEKYRIEIKLLLILYRIYGIELLYKIFGIKLSNNNDIVILTTIGLFIYHFNESKQSISLHYFYHMNFYHLDSHFAKIVMMKLQNYRFKGFKKISSKSILPSPSSPSFRLDGWVSVKDDKLSLLKYGVGLLSIAIKEHNLDLVEDLYKKCINYFKQDLKNNRMFLSIITSTMPMLNENYPEYILRYQSETTMIIVDGIERQSKNLHLRSFSQHPQIVNLTPSIVWTKYAFISKYYPDSIRYKVLQLFIWIIIALFIIIFFFLSSAPFLPGIFYILSKFHLVNNIYEGVGDVFRELYFALKSVKHHITTPTITFMIPYIKFVNYPRKYNWFLELIRPQSSPFVKTISRDIYKTWDGEALINFKWNAYGKYYYAIIWIGFTTLLVCFTVATIPQQYLNDNVQKQLFIASIALGFIHLSFEIRQFIYNPIKWFSFWNLWDMTAFLLPICTSIYWLRTKDRNVQLDSFSCLFLDIKFLFFFRVFEDFGVYFAIISSVAKKIFSFLVVLLIIVISFAHAFFILLSPGSDISLKNYTKNDDPNNPWNIAPTYNQIFENGTMDSNPFIIQPPNGNTNMFINYRTALFAMYKFLTGDSSALSNWSYSENPPLTILVFLFSLLIVVYLMNLLIGLLNIAIEQDNNRVSYLIEKAKILAEIELFYLLPCQRRWKTWFPDTIYYFASVNETRKKVKEMISKGEWNTDQFPELRKDLLNKLDIPHNPDN